MLYRPRPTAGGFCPACWGGGRKFSLSSPSSLFIKFLFFVSAYSLQVSIACKMFLITVHSETVLNTPRNTPTDSFTRCEMLVFFRRAGVRLIQYSSEKYARQLFLWCLAPARPSLRVEYHREQANAGKILGH